MGHLLQGGLCIKKDLFNIGILGLYAGFLLAETHHPDVAIGVCNMETGE
jgi:hypothetical protein